MSDAGRIDDRLADALGRAIAKVHESALPNQNACFVDELTEIITQNEMELLGSPDLFAMSAVTKLTAATRGALEPVRTLLAERTGFVRRCHGDFHLGNIVLLNGEPVLFDAIEFDPVISTIKSPA